MTVAATTEEIEESVTDRETAVPTRRQLGSDQILASCMTSALVIGSGLSSEKVGQRPIKGLQTPQQVLRVAGRAARRHEPSPAS